MMTAKTLRNKISSKQAVVAIVGLGYVGLPLAVAYAKKGFPTIGIDVSSERVKSVKNGISYIDDVSGDELAKVQKDFSFKPTTDFKVLKQADCVIICVPTPLSKTRQPDLSYVLAAVGEVARYIHRGELVVLESTTYPGTTEENIRPMLEGPSGLKVEKDIYLGFSPERVDPGNRHFAMTDIPKVIGGVGPSSTKTIRLLYEEVFKTVVPVSSSKCAEMVKLLENTFRSVNIGLINETAKACHTLGIDIWEVIRAASTKSFGYMPFYPGPGIGGHCINIDSMYLAWKSRLHGFEPRLIELAQQINDDIPHFIVERTNKILNDFGKPIRGSRILVLGVSYKKNVRDTRESPSLEIMKELKGLGAKLSYHDPFVPSVSLEGDRIRSISLKESTLKRQDLVMILTDHDGIDYKEIAGSGTAIFDTRNAFGSIGKKYRNVIKL